MKNRFLITTGLFICAVLCGCGRPVQTEYKVAATDFDNMSQAESYKIHNESIKPKIKEIKAYYKSTINTNYTEGYTVSKYDEEGWLLSKTDYDKNDSFKSETIYTYDECKRLLARICYDESGEPKWGDITEYDENGNVLTEKSVEKGGNERVRIRYEYDIAGILLREIQYDNHEEEEAYNVYTYDDKGNVSLMRHVSPDGYEYKKIEYEYYDDGIMKKKTETAYGHYTVYEYDEEERCIHEVMGFVDGEVSATWDKVYGPYGLIDEYSYDGDGTFRRHTKNVYNRNGELISVFDVDENGKKTKKESFDYTNDGKIDIYHNLRGYDNEKEYNEYGYVTKSHDVCNDMTRNAGTYDIITTYEYVYY